MREHLICFTVDTDPDGLNSARVDRSTLCWEGLRQIRRLPHFLEDYRGLTGLHVPITWFVRVDGQLRDVFGTPLYLLENFASFWQEAATRCDELAWHPHLYRQKNRADVPELITDPAEACEELERLWEDLARWPMAPTSFRNGEGWHIDSTLSAVEKCGILYDSTAIPGRIGTNGHPMDWAGAPNQPYFPKRGDIRKPGAERPLLELPMNTWLVQAPYDRQPRLRYMNPAVHESIFSQALRDWAGIMPETADGLCVWVLICHPDELMEGRAPDALYARSSEALCRNLVSLGEHVRRDGESCRFVTISDAGQRWKNHKEMES